MNTGESAYNSLSYIRDDEKLWSMNGLITDNFLAGLLVGFEIVSSSRDSIRILDRRYIPGNLSQTIPNYYVRSSDCSEIMDILPAKGQFGWWIKVRDKCTLFSFSNADFIQGFIAILEAFFLDFREYIIGPPFTYDKERLFYEVEGYDIAPFPEPKRLAPVSAFYTGSYESDIGDVDYI